MLVLVQVHVVECTLLILWLQPLRHWGCRLPFSSSNPAVSQEKIQDCKAVGVRLYEATY